MSTRELHHSMLAIACFALAAASATGLLLSGPTGGGMAAASGPSEPTFRSDVMPVLQKSCGIAGCHSGSEARANWRVSDADGTYHSLVNTPATLKPSMVRVKPGKPDESVFWLKLAGKHKQAGIPGATMPIGRPLPKDQMDTIQTWIRKGAAQ